MKYLLDTDVTSQLIKLQPAPGVIPWFQSQEEKSLHLSVATLLEIRTGIESLPAGKKRSALDHWLDRELRPRFAERILDVNPEVADLCGRFIARTKREGWNVGPMDALIAATAMVHQMTLATLNVKHFSNLGLKLVRF